MEEKREESTDDQVTNTLSIRLLTHVARRGFAGAAPGSAVCGRQPSRGSSVPPSLIFPLFVSLSSARALPCPHPPPPPLHLPSRKLRVATTKVKKVRNRNARACKTTSLSRIDETSKSSKILYL